MDHRCMSARLIATLERGWHNALSELVEQTEEHLLVAAPFITTEGTTLVAKKLSPRVRSTGRLHLLTDLSPMHVCDGSLEPAALGELYDAVAGASLWHIPRLHAKVYIADRRRAIVTSGNLTATALYRNLEYGVDISDANIVQIIADQLSVFQATGASLSRGQLAGYVAAAAEVRAEFARVQRSASASATRAFRQAVRRAEDDLVRLKLAGGATHTVFARTIAVLLRKYGPMSTVQIHHCVKDLHPDLCDDSVDRVIDGQRFGKKWKHAVRTAQQMLKRRGEITNIDGLWIAEPAPSVKGGSA
jgi:HKD family nuclease